MSAPIVLPTLKEWVEQHVRAIYVAEPGKEFDIAFNTFIHEHATITVNGRKLSRQEYKKQLETQKADQKSAVVEFLSAVEVAGDNHKPPLTGDVGTAFQVTIDERFPHTGIPRSRSIDSSLNVAIIFDENIQPGQGEPVGDHDQRRVSVLSQVTSVRTNL
ncbi:hypothetical protein BXZ70DRAFT_1066866 [Cristinia sonorae]|uniref:Uncharacterized protein n=1 Tax=Cristinia sonorae TaxID=1940300 RepID=A0A8K0XM99_9AGAR|nr:hypothetical protein BXZ70DRAFT_1066866 [Cristinia sonorae]